MLWSANWHDWAARFPLRAHRIDLPCETVRYKRIRAAWFREVFPRFNRVTFRLVKKEPYTAQSTLFGWRNLAAMNVE